MSDQQVHIMGPRPIPKTNVSIPFEENGVRIRIYRTESRAVPDKRFIHVDLEVDDDGNGWPSLVIKEYWRLDTTAFFIPWQVRRTVRRYMKAIAKAKKAHDDLGRIVVDEQVRMLGTIGTGDLSMVKKGEPDE